MLATSVRLQLIVAVLLCFTTAIVEATALESMVTIDKQFHHKNLNSHAGFLEDPNALLTINEISSSIYQDRFEQVSVTEPSFGFTSSAYWVRLQLENSSPEKAKLVLHIPYAALDLIEIFVPQPDGTYISKSAGDSVSFSRREISYPTPAFYIELLPDRVQDIYIRAKTTSSMQLPLDLWSTDSFTNRTTSEQLFWGLLFGALLIAACYNLFLFFSVQDRVFLYYVLFVSTLIMTQLTLYGYSIQYFWPNRPEFSNTALLIFMNVNIVFATLFSRQFLKLKQYAPKLDLLLWILCIYMLGGLVSSLFAPYSLVLKAYILGLTIGAPLFIVAGFICWLKGYVPAKIYLVAWMVLVLGGIAYSLKTGGYLPVTDLSKYTLPIGSLVEVVLFSIALGTRVNLQKKETYAAKKAMMAMQEQVYEANRIALRKSQESDQLKQEFLATMSHELRTPMNGILGSCELLDISKMSSEDKQLMSALTDSARQMMGHVNRILNFSQLNQGTLSIESSKFDLLKIRNSLTSNFSSYCKEKELQFSIDIESNIPRYLTGDAQKILHVLSDVIDNGIRFTDRGSVHVHFFTTPDFDSNNTGSIDLYIRVQDTGIGVDDEAKQSIFEMFSQKDGSFKRTKGGLGLGLAICNKYVELMHGKLNFQSETGVGTTIEICLPLKVATDKDKASTHSTAEQNNPQDRAILVVEDNPTNQLIMKSMLKRLLYKADVAANGIEALEALEKAPYDLILMDCQMPYMDGFEATQEIRKRDWSFNDIPIIAVTANTMAGDKEHCLEVGMNDYLSKPIDKKSIEEKLNAWLVRNNADTIKP